MLSRIGLFSSCARRKASSPHGYHSTGLCACCKRYGLVSFCRRFVCLCSAISPCPFFFVCDHSTAPRADCNFDKRGVFVILRKLNGDSFFKGRTASHCLC